MTTIWFDMDGTIADLYGVDNWLEYLINNDPFPYSTAKPLVNTIALNLCFKHLQIKGYRIGIISWLAKNSNEDYDRAVTTAKLTWLKTHFPTVQFDDINIVPYGTPKSNFINDFSDILFDDEFPNRNSWRGGKAYDEKNIIENLNALLIA